MDTIQDYTNRPRRYFNIDGLGEVSLGLMCLGMALLAWLRESTPRDSMWNAWYGFWSYWGVLALILHYGPQAIKKRITYLRTGFVDYPLKAFVVASYQDTLTIIIVVAVLLGLPALLIFAPGVMTPLVRPSFDRSSLAWVYGIILAVVYAARIAGRIRWKWIVALILACGSIATSIFSMGVNERLVLLIVFYAVTFLISGGISFYLYLKHTQPAARAAE